MLLRRRANLLGFKSASRQLVHPTLYRVTQWDHLRLYSSPPQNTKRDEPPSFKKIFLVAILGTLIFVQTANSLDKNRPKTSYSETEFENVMQGLKRRVAIFPPGELDVQFVLSPDVESLKKNLNGSAVFINPASVVEYYRTSKNDQYEALLNDIFTKQQSADYINNLPPGMLVMLIGRYMKEKCSAHDRVFIINFPHNIKEAIKFENEVSVISKILVPKDELKSDICKYYQTVNKVEQI